MESGFESTPYTSETMATLGVHRVAKTVGYETPLHGEILSLVYRQALVDAPAPVSYTHLDVYKRQYQSRVLWI